jgi:hypothetical protein
MPRPLHPPWFYLPNDNELTSGIYRKPTYTDIIITNLPVTWTIISSQHTIICYTECTKEEKEKKEFEQRFDSSKQWIQRRWYLDNFQEPKLKLISSRNTSPFRIKK